MQPPLAAVLRDKDSGTLNVPVATWPEGKMGKKLEDKQGAGMTSYSYSPATPVLKLQLD